VGKVTSKLQVTVPKAIADRYGIRPGDEIEWFAADDAIRVVVRRPASRASRAAREDERARRLRLFDLATARQRSPEQQAPPRSASGGRGWTRDDLYDRGGAD
jgi:AbrB family looped-hinge helix DNA binding protein